MRRVIPILCLFSAACGDPLVEGDYRGQPLIEISGTINVEDELTEAESNAVRVGLLWVGAAQQGDLSGRSESSFPARYSMKVFARPPDRAMRALPDRAGLQGTARIVLYIDDDGDDQLDSLERVVGAAPDQVLTYFTSSEPTSLVRGAVRTGYQVMNLFACDDRLTDKATYGPATSEQSVNLRLASGIAGTLLDIDCDTVSDDLCYDLRLQIQENPDDAGLIALYQDRCDVQFEPEFNNTSTTPNNGANPDGNTEPQPNAKPGEPTCDTDPNLPDCQPDNKPDAEMVVGECSSLLTGAIGSTAAAQREAYWRFSQCTEQFDPCGELGWNGGEEGWMDYQSCTFRKVPQHQETWCRDVFERMGNADGEDLQFLEAEFARGDCEAVI